MPRRARKRGALDIYHVICRGIGKQILFEEEADCRYYLELLQQAKESFPCEIYAYCLMENHIHLLLYIPRDLDRFVKSVSGRYAMYFNRKYDRCGHVFQDRFRSEPIENGGYLLSVVRYIHNNPEAAGICPREQYPWSSWQEYVGTAVLIDAGNVLAALGGREGFLAFGRADGSPAPGPADPPSGPRMPDHEARRIMQEVLCAESPTRLQRLKKAERDEFIRILRKRGISVRQLERLSGISRGIIQEIK